MMTGTAVDVRTIPRITHAEAMAVAVVENRRFAEQLATFDDEDWSRPTGCSVRRSGATWDGMNGVQVRERATCSPQDLIDEWATTSARAVAARRKLPRPVAAPRCRCRCRCRCSSFRHRWAGDRSPTCSTWAAPATSGHTGSTWLWRPDVTFTPHRATTAGSSRI